MCPNVDPLIYEFNLFIFTCQGNSRENIVFPTKDLKINGYSSGKILINNYFQTK